MHWLPVLLILPYVIILFRIYRGLLRLKPFKVSADPSTFISVVIACRNEEKKLPSLLDKLSRQNYSKYLFEVIIVDDNSVDNTTEMAAGFTGISNIITVKSTGIGKKQALRTGIGAAKGSLIITTDADCAMEENWIRTIAAFYEMNKPDMIICPVQLESVPILFGKFQELEFMSLQGITAGTTMNKEATMCNGSNLAFGRQVYSDHSANLYDEINSGDDVFLLHSLKKKSQPKVSWLESFDSLVTTEASYSFMAYMLQRRRWISKGKAFKDRDTIILGIIVFVTIILQISYLIAWLINPALIWVFLSILILKSLPDFFILLNTTGRYCKRKLMRWFLPAELIYPFYVLSVVFFSLIFRKK